MSSHPDDIAVDRFATMMKDKLAAARAKGRGGWDDPSQCTVEDLSIMLRVHVGKGDPVDVANFAMMLSMRGSAIVPVAPPAVVRPDFSQIDLRLFEKGRRQQAEKDRRDHEDRRRSGAAEPSTGDQ